MILELVHAGIQTATMTPLSPFHTSSMEMVKAATRYVHVEMLPVQKVITTIAY